jgi:hypothetical protein
MAAAAVTARNIPTLSEITGGRGQSLAAAEHVKDLIDHVPAPRAGFHPVIRHAAYLFDLDSVTDSLVVAHRRGVNVQVIISKWANSQEISRLANELGRDKTKPSFLYRPAEGGLSDNVHANMHAKLWTFSHSGSKTNYSGAGSGNMNKGNTLGSTNEWQFYDADPIYKGFVSYFNAIKTDRSNSHYYRTVSSGAVKIHFYPGAPDIIGARLNKISASKCRKTRIDIDVFQWTDTEDARARRLWYLASKGCDVNVIWNYQTSRVLIGAKIGRILMAKKNGKRIIEIRNARRTGTYDHDKRMLVNYDGTKKVYAGSANWKKGSRVFNADILTENSSDFVYDTSLAHWRAVWYDSLPATLPVYGPGIASADESYEGDDLDG